MDDRGQYSTLELANAEHNGPLGYNNGLEVVSPSVPPQTTEGNNYPEAAIKPEYPTAENSNLPEVAAIQESSLPSGGKGERRICGLKRKVFIPLVALLALLVIGAVVGGAVGGTVGKSKSSTTSGSPTTTTSATPVITTSTPTATPAILANSSLGSVNWTDSKGYSHHAVFYQHRSTSLMLSLWDSQNTTWKVNNISASLNSTMAPLSGTPLTSAVSPSPYPFQFNLYYLSASNQVMELITNDTQGGNWQVGLLSNNRIQAGAGSQLASYWQRCTYQCSQEVILLYEDSSQRLNIANSSDWEDTYLPIGSNINSGSGLALVPLAPLGGVNTQPYQMRAYVDISDRSQELMWRNSGLEDWVNGGLPTLPLGDSPPKFTAASFGTPSQGFYSIMLVFLFSNGTISANWFDNTVWHTYITPTPTMAQSNFTAIAINMDLRFYGLSSGMIYEYSVDGSNPFDWSYVNPVNTTITT